MLMHVDIAGRQIPLPARIPGALADLRPIPGVSFLGFGYKARHGKNAACDWIHIRFPSVTRVCAFADALKAYGRSNGMTRKDSNFLQQLGNSVRTRVDVDHWIKALYWTIDEVRPRYVLISDVRFRNEAQFVKQMGGTLVKITRYHEDGSMFVDPSRDPCHPSETDMDSYAEWDYEIRNDQSVGHLYGRAIFLFYQFLDIKTTSGEIE